MRTLSRYNIISDYFIALSNETQSLITNLKLQKIVYYAQAWHLAIIGKELFKEDFQAWVHGPVIPELYYTYKEFGWKPIIREDLKPAILSRIKKEFPEETKKLLEDVTYEYFGLPTFELERLTHNEFPWMITRNGLPADEPSDRVIQKSLIKKYYAKFVHG
jgi:uncharacterized phage-associated protein